MRHQKNLDFFHAVSCGDYKKVKRWLEKGVSPNFVHSRSYPLMKAVERNNTKMVSLLLEHGARRCGLSPLVSALEHYNYAVLVMLIEQGNMYTHACNLSYLFYFYCRTLTDTTKPWQKEIGEYLLDSGADPFEFSPDGSFPLWVAAEKGNITAVKLLVDFCRKNNCVQELIHQVKDNTHSSPLYLACQNGHFQVVDCLLNAKVDPNVRTMFGATPLYVSAERGYYRIVHLLLLHGANPNAGALRPMIAAFNKGYDATGELIYKAVRCRREASEHNIDFFVRGIETDTLGPYLEQWAPHFPYEVTFLFDFIKEKLLNSIIRGKPPPRCLKGIVRFFPYDHRVEFFQWVVRSYLFQRVCSSVVFAESFHPVHHIVASYLEYQQPLSRALLATFYCDHLHEFDSYDFHKV